MVMMVVVVEVVVVVGGSLWLVPTQVTQRTVQLVSQLCFYEILLNYCKEEDNIK